ncbi:GTPase [Salinicoccus sediminis]|uniref:GTPase n=1 Tax=Salinicoccus sediminis TaxID=1432562 RepID=A0A0M2SS28_9STAP|nr:ribosome biogenesis GTPase YqeH [Salinicoccus sediminis]KKK35445.1 GTPase [Salinicoccus sediminis]
MEQLKCIGCGAVLQSEDETKPGFIPASGMGREDAICKRCYRLKHYNEVMDLDVDSGEFMAMLNALYETDGLIVKVLDVFDFNGSIIPSFNRIVGDKKVLAVINKIDLLPRSVNRNRVVHRAKHMLSEAGIKAVDTVVISAKKNEGIDMLVRKMQDLARGQDVYVVGTTNVGKSTLINKLIENTTGDKEVITTSKFPGTTLDLIDIPLGGDSYIFDTPGVVVDSQMAHYVHKDSLKYITPGKEIKSKGFQLDPGQTLFISNLARIDFTDGGRSSFNVYASDKVNIHRTKLRNADEFYDRHYNGLLAPPEIDRPYLSEEFSEFEFTTDADSDISISGLAFISTGPGATVRVRVPKGVDVVLRPTIFKGGV